MPTQAPSGMPQASVLCPFEPQAWYVNASNGPSMINIFQYLHFALSIGIFLGLRLPSLAILTENFATISTNLHAYWHTYATFQTLMAVSAPMLWFLLGVMTSYLYSLSTLAHTEAIHPIQLFKHEPRRNRCQSKPKHKRNWKLKSIKQCHLSPSYPLCLRKDNVFNRRHDAPTLDQQHISNMLEKWVISGSTNVGTITSDSNFNTYYNSRKGKSKSNKNKGYNKQRKHHLHHHTQPFHHKSTVCIKCCNQDKQMRHPRYKPTGVPTARYNPNLNFTSSQLQNARQQAARALMLGVNISDQTKSLATMIVQSVPACFRSQVTTSKNSSSFNLIWDTGASICITPSRDDFVEYYKGSDVKEVKGLSEKAKVKGYGFV